MPDPIPLPKKLEPVPLPPNQELITQAELILQKCKAGEITGMIVVTNARNDWTGAMCWGVMTYAMVGRLNEMIRNTLKEMDG